MIIVNFVISSGSRNSAVN